MKARKKRISKLERIPKVGTPVRNVLLGMLLEMSDYTEVTKRCPSFLTKKDIEGISEKYADGMAWEDIDAVMSSKGILLKYATFRKYMQNEIIPKATKYKKTENGRVAVYDSDIIMHLNFVNYFYNVMDEAMLDKLTQLICSFKTSYKTTVETELTNNFYLSLIHQITLGTGDVTDAVEKTLCRRNDLPKIISMIDNIQSKFDKHVAKYISELEEYLDSHEMPITEVADERPISGEVTS
jgi:hypothetical protein